MARLKQFFKSFHLIYWFGLNKGQLCWFSSCKKIPSPFQCLKPHFVIQISHLFVGEVSLLTQSRGGSNSKVPVLAECSGIQTVMNRGGNEFHTVLWKILQLLELWAMLISSPPEEGSFGIASWKQPDMPAYPPGTCTNSL